MLLTDTVTLREVGLRDGLQSISKTLCTAHKIDWLRAAHAAGLREIEVGSFVPARLLPQLAHSVWPPRPRSWPASARPASVAD